MYLRPVVAVLSLVYKTTLATDNEKEGADQRGSRGKFVPAHVSSSFADLSASSAKDSWKDSWKNSAIVTKLQRDADLHNAILAGIGDKNRHHANLRLRRRRARTAGTAGVKQTQMVRRDDMPSSSKMTVVSEECNLGEDMIGSDEPDAGILSGSSKNCPEKHVCVPSESSIRGGVCVSESSTTTDQRNLGATDKNFCECLFYSDPLEEAACFDKVVTYCTGSTPPSCVTADDGPYAWAYCDYFRCLSEVQNAGRRLAPSFTKEETETCWCNGYYAAVHYMCSPQVDEVTGETFLFVNDDICDDLEEIGKTVACCQDTGDAVTCLDNHGEEDDDDGPTFEPTEEPTDPPAMEPTSVSTPFDFVFNATEANRLATTCDPAVEVLLPQCNITDAYECTASPECRWRPLKVKCVGICQDRSEDSCRGRSECAWDMERECCAKAAPMN